MLTIDEKKQKKKESDKRYRELYLERCKENNKQWRLANPEKIKESRRQDYIKNFKRYKELARKWIEAHPDKIKEIKNRWLEKNREKARKSVDRYRKQYPEKVKENFNSWRKRNRGKVAVQDHRRRAKKSGNGGSFTAGEWELLKKQYGYTCPMCNKKEPEIKLTIDHVIPINKGGINRIENIQPLCKSCNSKKHTDIFRITPDGGLMLF